MATQGRLIGLEGLRGIAALSVFAHHAVTISTGEGHGSAYLAVDFFFMLSGFVMARTYEARFGKGFGAIVFMRARLRRLMPVMAVGGVIGLPVLASKLSGLELAQTAALNLLLLPSFVGNFVFPLNFPAWSIFFELSANLAHVTILRRLGAKPLAAVVVLAALLPLAIFALPQFTLNVGARSDDFLLGFLRVLLSYGIGVILWRTWGDQPGLQASTLFAVAAMPVLFLAAFMLDVHSLPFDLLFVLAACPLMLAGGLAFSGEAHPRLAAVATVIGALSFPLYAVHTPILELSQLAGQGPASGIVLSLLAASLIALAPRYLAWQRLAFARLGAARS